MAGKEKSRRPGFVAIAGLGIGLVVIAFGGIAFASITAGGSPGFVSASSGSAPEPPQSPPPSPPQPAPDTTPPTLVGVGGTHTTTTKKRAKFRFSANEAARFQCKVDGGEYKPCTSPFVAPKLRPGQHKFFVQAIDAAGNPSTVKVITFRVKKAHHKKHHHQPSHS